MFGTKERLISTDEWLRRLNAGERRALAQLLSCAESTNDENERFMSDLLSAAGTEPHAIRIGITGIPGAGKSSLIDALGLEFLRRGKRVAVLAVDPSSPVSGGSILGDKVRMQRLAQESAAFVRPLANGGLVGGGVYALDDCVRLCELARYDVVVVETVGVGQNETDVGLVCDVTLLVVVAGTGDEIQALKRGITEVIDLIALNKADLATSHALDAVQHSYREGLSYSRKGPIAVVPCSATVGTGVQSLATELLALAIEHATQQPRGNKRQRLLRRMIEHALVRRFWSGAGETHEFQQLNQAFVAGQINLRAALNGALMLRENVPAPQMCPPDQD